MFNGAALSHSLQRKQTFAAGYHLVVCVRASSLQNQSMDLNAYSRLWDGSEPGWTVVRRTEDRERISIVFAQDGPTIADIKALRTVVPDLQAKTASAALADLKGHAEVLLGEFESQAARVLRKRCESAGLRVVSSPHRTTRDSLINEQLKKFLLIEDGPLSQAVAKEAIKQGLPLRHSTA